jgi:hypothetical protein
MQALASGARNIGIAAVTVGVLADYCMYDVDAGTRVVIFDSINGVLPGVYTEGTHFKLPWQVRNLTLSIPIFPLVVPTPSLTR